MERKIPITILTNTEKKTSKENNPFVPEELPPLVTFADDDVDDAISSNSDECLSIEELESAVFSENEEGIGNVLAIKYIFYTFQKRSKM